ncbi:MAG: glycosyltransferase family 39 protein [bacterium]|nr:glycosyltransferase family 39 protein [bacterium]
MKRIDYLFLSIILIIAMGLRLYNIDTPLADLHSWRQADTAAVARNFSRDGINLLKPTYDDLSSIQTGIENPEGLRMVEFPLYNAIVSLFVRYLPLASVTVYGRLVSSMFSLVTIAILYYFGLKEKNRLAGIAAAGIFAMYPFFVFFSRTVLPETTAVSFMMISLFLLHTGFDKTNSLRVMPFIGSILFFALSVLIKPTTIFYAFAAGYLFIDHYRFDVFKNWRPYAFFILALIPFALWRWYILAFPEGIPASAWLITHVNTFEGPKNIFFKPAFFRWIFMERIGIAMFGIFGTFFLLFGVIGKYKRFFIHSMLFSAFVYLFTFQGGNVQHEYYQIILLPALALAAGAGLAQLAELPGKFVHGFILYPTILVVFGIGFLFSYYKVKDYYYYPKDLPQIAQLIQAFTKPTDKIVTDRTGDTTLLYLADRKGAPAVYKDIPTLQQLGYSFLITSNGEMTNELKEQGFVVLVENEFYSIIQL